MGEILNTGHWQLEDFRQRMTREDWRQILLNGQDSIVVKGHIRYLVAKNLGAGVYEVYKEPLKEASDVEGGQ